MNINVDFNGLQGARTVLPYSILKCDLTKEQVKLCLSLASGVLDQPKQGSAVELEMATTIKKAFEDKYPGAWHAIAGPKFGCSLTHKTNQTMYFSIRQSEVETMYIVLWQSLI